MKELIRYFLISQINTNYHNYVFQYIVNLEVKNFNLDGHRVEVEFAYIDEFSEQWVDDRLTISCWEIMEFLFTEIKNK